jgi:glycosyltransferase involved in cell wall biosynthesis
MALSFCIITAGKKPEITRLVLKSIKVQNIPDHEIIVVGDYQPEPGIIFIEARASARNGRLGEMRNLGVAQTKFANIIILDDDIILSPSWYSDFLSYDHPFDILTSQVRVPDGSRYWDHATVGGPRGHIVLSENEEDEHVYMTGGGGWVMKDHVAKNVAWDEGRAFYEGEDVDFSRRCQAQGYKISHNHKMLVFHADPTYTCIGRNVYRRQQDRTQEWVKQAFRNPSRFQVIKRFRGLMKDEQIAEASDFLRMGMQRFPHSWIIKREWRNFVAGYGGDLPGSRWFPDADPEFIRAMEMTDG